MNGMPMFIPLNINRTAISEINRGTILRKEFLVCKLKKCLKKVIPIIAGRVPIPNEAINKML